MKFLLALLVIPQIALAATTCKIKTIEYADGWLSNEMKQAFATKGYTLLGPYEEGEFDYKLEYELKTYGMYPCRIAAFTCTGSKRFARLDLQKVGSEKSVISLEVSSKKKEWDELRELIEVDFLKKMTKLPACK